MTCCGVVGKAARSTCDPCSAAAADHCWLHAQRYVSQGIAIDLDLAAPDGMVAGRDIRLSLHLSDAVAGTPLVAAQPAAWLSLNRRGIATDEGVCTRKVAAFLGSNPLAKPDVDLTGFSLLTMNRDPSITVIDPQSGYNGSRTITELAFDSPGPTGRSDLIRHGSMLRRLPRDASR